jgi:alpha-beta hydrolase superfamily lysophospholipase
MDKNLTNFDCNLHIKLSNQESIKGIIHISHGMGEHIGRYKWLIKNLNNDGYHVISNDHRGHGTKITDFSSQGYFSNSQGFKKVSDDLVDLVDIVNSNYPDINQYMIAHSMGSWISLSALIDSMKIDGLILSGSGYVSKHIIFMQCIALNISEFFYGDKSESLLMHKITFENYNNYFKPTNTNSDWISSDSESVSDYEADPLCGFKSKINLWKNMTKIFLRVFKFSSYKKVNKNLPIYIISGAEDPVGGFGKNVNKLFLFLSQIFSNVTLDIIENARHEVFSETNKQKSYNKVVNFLESI